jgi:hypothetical protein
MVVDGTLFTPNGFPGVIEKECKAVPSQSDREAKTALNGITDPPHQQALEDNSRLSDRYNNPRHAQSPWQRRILSDSEPNEERFIHHEGHDG